MSRMEQAHDRAFGRRCQMTAEALREHAAEVVADWPTLTPEQLNRVAVLLKRGRDR